MRIGMSLTTSVDGDASAAMTRVLERVEVAAGAGLDHLGFGDQHAVGPAGQRLQGVPVLARALAAWPRDRPAGLLFLVPLWHPVLMAELVGTLATLSDRPLIVQTGIGSGAGQFAAMGADTRTRGAETDRRIRLVTSLLRGAVVDDAELGIAGAAIGPVPPHGVEWWIGSGAAPAALDRAARFGDALYLGPTWGHEEIARLGNSYRSRCDREERPARVVLRRDLVLADDEAEANRLADDVVASGYRGLARAVVVAGGVASVADEFRGLADLGVDEISARVISVPQPSALRTIELLGAVRNELS